ncbi:hypothetical protein BDR03DRAFT_965964 [Suillus americanus]|nr:hypothetical protein BDR03DRAFT_965964 [Suillus americanus]
MHQRLTPLRAIHYVLEFEFVGTSVSASAPLRASSLYRSSTLAIASSCNMCVDAGENLFKAAEFRCSGGYPDAAIVGVKVKKVQSLLTSSLIEGKIDRAAWRLFVDDGLWPRVIMWVNYPC